jgi:tripartite-type tricarboxylate transporter receptor subunit TctC
MQDWHMGEARTRAMSMYAVTIRFQLYVAFFVCLALGSGVSHAGAQGYPSQTIRWIVTSGTGGAFDALARGLAPSLGKHMGVNVVVETVPGPDGWNRIYLAKPDGYTIGIGDPVGEFGNAAVNPVPYKLETFTWLGRLNSASNLAVASKKSGLTSLDQVKRAGQSVRLATFGVSAPLIQMILLSEAVKFKLSTVNFRTPADVMFGLVRGDVDLANLGIQLWTKHIQAGNAVPVLLFDEKQDARVPGVPALPDIGQPDLVRLMTQRSIIAPPNLPPEIEAKLIDGLKKSVSEGDGLAFLNRANFELNSLWGPEFKAVVSGIQKDIEKNHDTLRKFATQ